MILYHLCSLGLPAVFLLVTGKWVDGASFPQGKDMKVIFKWRYFDFVWPNEKARDEAIRNKKYDLRNVSASDVNLFNHRYFVTTPRLKYGVPVTLSTISDKKRNGQYLLRPFPDWEFNREGNCNGLTSVYRTQIDEFGRLWTLDSGVEDNLTGRPKRICQPQIVVFDLNAGDKLVGRYRVPDDVLDCNSLLFDFQVDLRNNNAEDVVVYMCDAFAHHIVVFDLRHKSFHRITQNSFSPNPHDADFYIAGTRLFVTDGIYSLALGPICNGDRRVYYHAISSLEECWVMASTLRDKAYVTNERTYPDSFFCYSKRRDSQSAPEVVTEDGIMFFQQQTLNAIGCWNTEIDYNMENSAIVARNDTTMQAIEGLKLVGSDLYAISTRVQLFVFGLLSENEINYRVLRAGVSELIQGTFCEKPCLPEKPVYKSYSPS